MRTTFIAAALGLALAACNEDPGAENGQGDHKPDPLPASTAKGYPEAPYGFAVGSVMEDFDFPGFGNAQVENQTVQTLHFSDFYNPHADDPTYAPADPSMDDRLYPKGSPYGEGQPKPRALLVALGSVWCGPCNQEAKTLFPGKRAMYRPCGGEIMYQLIESTAGTLSNDDNLRAWTKVYKIDYPAARDPMRKLNPLYADNSFPHAALIDTRSMKIVARYDALPDDVWATAYEPLLDQKCLAAQK
jgi:hypothetical protein